MPYAPELSAQYQVPPQNDFCSIEVEELITVHFLPFTAHRPLSSVSFRNWNFDLRLSFSYSFLQPDLYLHYQGAWNEALKAIGGN